jgi:hypothetical protein
MDNAVSLDQIFSTALLKLVVPDTTLDFPPTVPTDEWLEAARSVSVERKQAFFGAIFRDSVTCVAFTNLR